MNQNPLSSNLQKATLIILGVLMLVFPLIFSQQTTDLFGLPKQVLLGLTALASFILFGIRMVAEGEVKLRRTPFDLAILLFGIAVLLSGIFSLDRADALTAFVPLLFAIIVYFVAVNTAKSESNVVFLLNALLLGGAVVAVLALLSFMQLYVLPPQYTHVRTFTPLGSLLDQALYLGFLLPLGGYLSYATLLPLISGRHKAQSLAIGRTLPFFICTILILVGFVITLISLFTLQNPLILPFATGFQTGFAAISQDTGRIAQSFLFGSGYGTYLVDFTRFKSATYNTNPSLWAFTFFRSSSLVLELLATVGIAGIISYLFLAFKVVKDRPRRSEGGYGIFLSVIIAVIASFILPFSFIPLTLLFFILSLYAAIQGLAHPNKVYDFSLGLVSLRRSLGATNTPNGEQHSYSSMLPALLLLVFIVISGAVGFYSVKYVMSDLTFQRSLVAASQNNGLVTYQLQNEAIGQFPYRDAYYRIFSQTNLALANSLALQQPKGKPVNQQTAQTIYTLVQQSINAGRSAVALSPANTLNWQNLSSIYRSLIGFGQNAEQFAVAANQQAILLDSSNPQEYINLGGIYYQLQQWDAAINQFALSVNLKPDFANAHYNLGHALEQKGDLPNAMTQYQLVKQLVANDPTNSAKISSEIKALQDKTNAAKSPKTQAHPTENQPPLGVNNPPAQLPERNPKATIPGPGVSPKIDKGATSPTPAPSGAISPTSAAPTPAP